jgi:hypothetical protein
MSDFEDTQEQLGATAGGAIQLAWRDVTMPGDNADTHQHTKC